LYVKRVQELERALERLDRKERKLIRAYLDEETDVFYETRDAIKSQRESIQQRLQEARKAARHWKDLESQIAAVQLSVSSIREKGGFAALQFDSQRLLVNNLIDEIAVNTREGWFEIRGVLRGTHPLDDRATSLTSSTSLPGKNATSSDPQEQSRQFDETCSRTQSGRRRRTGASGG
jgi:hypothetical protein